MNPVLTQDMVDGQDDMAGLLPAHMPASQQSAFFWKGAPSHIGATLHAPKKKRATPANGITVIGREQGQRDADRNFALRVGSIG